MDIYSAYLQRVVVRRQIPWLAGEPRIVVAQLSVLALVRHSYPSGVSRIAENDPLQIQLVWRERRNWEIESNIDCY